MLMFHTYIDWTAENAPRPFYIGKGNEGRTRRPERNQKHKHVRNAFGYRREIVFSSHDERECLDHEVQLIQEHHTFYLDEFADKEIACNFTKGGDGTTGWVPTDEQKKNISDGIKRAHRARPEIAEGISRRLKVRMNNPEFVSILSEKIKESFRNMPEEKKREIHRKASITRKANTSPSPIRGESSWRTTLTDETVKQIKIEYLILFDCYIKTRAIKFLCEKYHQGYNTIYKIVSHVTWKHVEV